MAEAKKRVTMKYGERCAEIIENLSTEPEQARELFSRLWNGNVPYFEYILDIRSLEGAEDLLKWEKRERIVHVWVESEEAREKLLELVEGLEKTDIQRPIRPCAKRSERKDNPAAEPKAKKAKKVKGGAREVESTSEAQPEPTPSTKSFEDQLAELDTVSAK